MPGGGAPGGGAPPGGGGAPGGGAGARINGTVAERRFPSCTTRLYVPGPIGCLGNGQRGADPMPVQVTAVVTCSPGANVLTRVSFEGAQSRLDHNRLLSSE